MFWQRVMQEVHNNVMKNLAQKQKDMLVSNRGERPVVIVKQYGMPRLKWKGDSLVIESLGRRDLFNQNQAAMVEFFINLDIALKLELVVAKSGLSNTIKYVIGPNLQYTLPQSTYNEDTMHTGDPFRKYYNWYAVHRGQLRQRTLSCGDQRRGGVFETAFEF